MGAFHHEQRYPVLATKVDKKSETFRGNREAALEALEAIRGHVAKAHEGGGAKYNERHVARGKLLPRQRVELLLDRDAPFLEIGALAGTGMPGETPGTSVAMCWSTMTYPLSSKGTSPFRYPLLGRRPT